MSLPQWIAGFFAGDAIPRMPTTHWRVAGSEFYVLQTATAFAQATANRIGRAVPVMVCPPDSEPHVAFEAYPKDAPLTFGLDPL